MKYPKYRIVEETCSLTGKPMFIAEVKTNWLSQWKWVAWNGPYFMPTMERAVNDIEDHKQSVIDNKKSIKIVPIKIQ